jgi:hypothetical protein
MSANFSSQLPRFRNRRSWCLARARRPSSNSSLVYWGSLRSLNRHNPKSIGCQRKAPGGWPTTPASCTAWALLRRTVDLAPVVVFVWGVVYALSYRRQSRNCLAKSATGRAFIGRTALDLYLGTCLLRMATYGATCQRGSRKPRTQALLKVGNNRRRFSEHPRARTALYLESC